MSKTLKNLFDIAAHMAGGAVIVITVLLWPWTIAGYNTVYWFRREWRQKPDLRWRVFTHPQSLKEWLGPTLAGWIAVGMLT